MPVDFRYHLASLTAVFGALLIGILLGVAMMEPRHLSAQVHKLTEDFQRSHEEDQHIQLQLQLQRDLDKRIDQFNERTQAPLIRNRLANHNVALVINAFVFPEDRIDAVRQALEQAGAAVTVQITLKAGLLQVEPDQIQGIYQQLQLPAETKMNISDLIYRLGQNLGRGGTKLADILQQAQLVDINNINGDLTTPVSSIIYLGGSSDSPLDALNTIDLPFLRACADSDVLIAATEPLEASKSVVADYQKVVPITIDNINHAAGRIALILALSGHRRGHFGYKQYADDVAPDTE